jgi:hypothetical protein
MLVIVILLAVYESSVVLRSGLDVCMSVVGLVCLFMSISSYDHEYKRLMSTCYDPRLGFIRFFLKLPSLSKIHIIMFGHFFIVPPWFFLFPGRPFLLPVILSILFYFLKPRLHDPIPD